MKATCLSECQRCTQSKNTIALNLRDKARLPCGAHLREIAPKILSVVDCPGKQVPTPVAPRCSECELCYVSPKTGANICRLSVRHASPETHPDLFCEQHPDFYLYRMAMREYRFDTRG